MFSWCIFLVTLVRIRQVYGNGKATDLLSLKYGKVLVERENRIKQKNNPQKSPSTTGVTAFADEREKKKWRKDFPVL